MKVRRGTIRTFFVAGFLAALVVDLALWSGHALHGHFAFEDIPGYGVIFGLLATALITAVSKLLGKLLLQKKDGYYD